MMINRTINVYSKSRTIDDLSNPPNYTPLHQTIIQENWYSVILHTWILTLCRNKYN